MLNALLNADLGANGVLEPGDGEGKRGVLLVDNRDELARILALKAVLHIELSLVYSRAGLSLTRDTSASGSVHIQADNITSGELPILGLLLGDVLVHDAVAAIDHVSLVLVTQDAVKGLATILVANGLDLVSQHGVLDAGSDGLSASLSSVVCSKDHISLTALGGTANDQGVSGKGGEAVHVSTEVDADEIAILEGLAVLGRRRVMAANLVHSEAGGESNTTLEVLALLASAKLVSLGLDESVNLLAHGGDVSACNGLGDSESKGS